MSHRSTALAKLREKDRNRQRLRRDRLKREGIPLPHQIDNAVAEALSFTLALALAGKEGVRAQPGVQQISFNQVVQTALDILTKRMRFHPNHAAVALKARLSKRPEHSVHSWTPHFPSCEPAFLRDMSTAFSHDTPVTPSGHVRTGIEEATQI